MTAVWILVTIFGSIILLLATICGTILVAMKLRHGSLSVKSREAQAEEAATIQEIYQGLTQMEKRVESLETLLMEQQQRDTNQDE
ncbi:MAG: phage-shock protein [Desulfobacterales bacterium]|nr:phage-shock protein [Desulfobacterales bacterium]MDJ0855510.1 phage-shock protein [Desulfobacterales bacterium]MDJ0885716.1 phage-shock protein [Desulfobacterales bacterium]MDJ0990807.1 phage-shock protein [Desulfobacterales bacterium]